MSNCGCGSNGGGLKLLQYNFSTETYTSTKAVTIDNMLNAITVKNTGTTNVLFNKETLQPGESKSIGGNYGEIMSTSAVINIDFAIPSPAPSTIVNEATVTTKFYTHQTFDR